MTASRVAAFVRYAALQFVALTSIAMATYPGGSWDESASRGYRFAHNFFSDLGATRTFSGASNTVSMVLFGIAMTTIGVAVAAFAWTWREFAFARRRARVAGIASAAFGTVSAAAFTAIAFAPIDRMLHLHNLLVMTAFGALLCYAACLTIVMWRNGIGGVRLAATVVYVMSVAGYIATIVHEVRAGSPDELIVLVVSQKLVVYASMAYIVLLATIIRRALRNSATP